MVESHSESLHEKSVQENVDDDILTRQYYPRKRENDCKLVWSPQKLIAALVFAGGGRQQICGPGNSHNEGLQIKFEHHYSLSTSTCAQSSLLIFLVTLQVYSMLSEKDFHCVYWGVLCNHREHKALRTRNETIRLRPSVWNYIFLHFHRECIEQNEVYLWHIFNVCIAKYPKWNCAYRWLCRITFNSKRFAKFVAKI